MLTQYLAAFDTKSHDVENASVRMFFSDTDSIGKAIRHQLNKVRMLHNELHAEARTDSLTGLKNRRGLEDVQARWLSMGRQNFRISAVVLDFDCFKQINDQLGHAVGDEILQAFGKVLRESIRASDDAIRLGGDEFVVFHMNMTTEETEYWYEKIRDLSEKFAKDIFPEGTDLNFGVSAGCSEIHLDDENIEAVLQRADSALYKAKQAGRNRMVCHCKNN